MSEISAVMASRGFPNSTVGMFPLLSVFPPFLPGAHKSSSQTKEKSSAAQEYRNHVAGFVDRTIRPAQKSCILPRLI